MQAYSDKVYKHLLNYKQQVDYSKTFSWSPTYDKILNLSTLPFLQYIRSCRVLHTLSCVIQPTLPERGEHQLRIYQRPKIKAQFCINEMQDTLLPPDQNKYL